MKKKHLCTFGEMIDQQNRDDDGDASKDSSRKSIVAYCATERCPICLNFLAQDIAFPENCFHAFCLTCILKWSETSSSCPVDRKPFQAVLKINPTTGCSKIHVKISRPTDSSEQYCCSKKECSIESENCKMCFRIETIREIPHLNPSSLEEKGCRFEEKCDFKSKINGSRRPNLCYIGDFSVISPPAILYDIGSHIGSGH